MILIYFQVSEHEVIPVEIHSVKNSTDPDFEDWLKDRHIQVLFVKNKIKVHFVYTLDVKKLNLFTFLNK